MNVATSPFGSLPRLKPAAVGLVDQGIVSVVNFFTVLLLARFLSSKEFGIFMVAHTVLILLTSLQNALVASPHNILGAERSGRSYAQLTLVLGVTQLIASVVIALVTAGVGLVWLMQHATEYAYVAFALAATIPAWMAQEFVRRVLYTKRDVTAAAINDFISYGLQIVGIGIVCVGWQGNSAPTIYAPLYALGALGFSSLAAFGFGLFQLKKQFETSEVKVTGFARERYSVSDFRSTALETWRLSKWLVAQQGVAWIGSSGHGLLLTALLGPATFGVYRAAYQVVNLLNPLRQAIANQLPSRTASAFARQGIANLPKWTAHVSMALSIPFALCAIAVAVGAMPLWHLMYGSPPQVSNLQLIVALGALSFTLNLARTPFDYAILVTGGARSIFIRTLWLNAFVVTAGIALILNLGIVGAMISELVTAALAAALTAKMFGVLMKPSNFATANGDPLALRSC